MAIDLLIARTAGVRGAAEGRGLSGEGQREATSPNEEAKAAVAPVADKVAFVREFHPRLAGVVAMGVVA